MDMRIVRALSGLRWRWAGLLCVGTDRLADRSLHPLFMAEPDETALDAH
jgi:hypothetical protein